MKKIVVLGIAGGLIVAGAVGVSALLGGDEQYDHYVALAAKQAVGGAQIVATEDLRIVGMDPSIIPSDALVLDMAHQRELAAQQNAKIGDEQAAATAFFVSQMNSKYYAAPVSANEILSLNDIVASPDMAAGKFVLTLTTPTNLGEEIKASSFKPVPYNSESHNGNVFIFDSSTTGDVVRQFTGWFTVKNIPAGTALSLEDIVSPKTNNALTAGNPEREEMLEGEISRLMQEIAEINEDREFQLEKFYDRRGRELEPIEVSQKVAADIVAAGATHADVEFFENVDGAPGELRRASSIHKNIKVIARRDHMNDVTRYFILMDKEKADLVMDAVREDRLVLRRLGKSAPFSAWTLSMGGKRYEGVSANKPFVPGASDEDVIPEVDQADDGIDVTDIFNLTDGLPQSVKDRLNEVQSETQNKQ